MLLLNTQPFYNSSDPSPSFANNYHHHHHQQPQHQHDDQTSAASAPEERVPIETDPPPSLKRSRDSGDVNPGNNLFVGNLSRMANENDLLPYFSKHGPIEQVIVMRDPHSGQHRGFAFVRFTNPEDALKAMEALQGCDLKGYPLHIQLVLSFLPPLPSFHTKVTMVIRERELDHILLRQDDTKDKASFLLIVLVVVVVLEGLLL